MESAPGSIDLRGEPAELVAMREFVNRCAEESGLAGADAFSACLVATEAVTNAMRHGCDEQQTECPITVSCRLDGTDFVLEVTDRGRFRSERPRENDNGGRGLFLIRELTQSFDLRAGRDGTHLSMRLATRARELAGSRAA